MPTPNHRHHFILDIWPEAVDPDQMEWRGKIQHLPSGEAYYFRDWGTLVEQLELLLALPLPTNDSAEK